MAATIGRENYTYRERSVDFSRRRYMMAAAEAAGPMLDPDAGPDTLSGFANKRV
ncbi:hypothetical protein N9L71_11525 [Verrucomicrobiales bacterium]|jgi:hypothetical protein|nr:hypothetical protein [Verrucomicrobiales bacterium]